MEPFKNLYNKESISEMANALQKAHPAFPKEKFLQEVLSKIKTLEMKDRVRSISAELKKSLPDYSSAVKILLKTIQSEKNPSGLNNFLVWPYTQFVEDFGLQDWNTSMNALKELTQVMSAEFAIRPFLIQHQEKTLKKMQEWTKSENHHVRRLCSEGTRPRLPWGQRLREFQNNPEYTLPILRALKNDSELYVRKSVANHLNDLAKDHPEKIIKELKNWVDEDPNNKNILWIAKHACRTLIKSGNKNALSLFGVKPAKVSKIKISINPAKIKMGESLHIHFEAYAHRKEKWLIDYVIHHKKSNGSLSPKVFKWTEKLVEKGTLKISKKHAFKKITTRKYYSGEHLAEVQLNGKPVAQKKFFLK